jgi:uncharacterized protein YxeA
MNYLKTIPYIIIIALLGGIVYLQFNFHRDITNINNQLVESQKQFAEYQLKQKEMQVNIITEITYHYFRERDRECSKRFWRFI